MRYQKVLSLVLLIILFPFRLLAWGHAGHAMVAELAMSMLRDATRVKVERVLGGMSVADAGNWMDQVKSDPQYKYTAPWHYVNIEPGGTYQPAPGGDIITALNKAYTRSCSTRRSFPRSRSDSMCWCCSTSAVICCSRFMSATARIRAVTTTK